MPAKSRSQQRLMQAAEHNAQFPLAQQIRASMTHQQMHDFASGSEQGKPQHVAKPLHPKMQERAQLVKEAHAHLAQAIPHFNQLPARQRMLATQEHVRTRKGSGY
jgi:hypothetical protein